MQSNHGAQEYAPEHEGYSTEGQQNQSEHNHWNVVVFRDPDVKFVLGQVRDVARQRGGIVVHRLADQDPAHVGPPGAVDR